MTLMDRIEEASRLREAKAAKALRRRGQNSAPVGIDVSRLFERLTIGVTGFLGESLEATVVPMWAGGGANVILLGGRHPVTGSLDRAGDLHLPGVPIRQAEEIRRQLVDGIRAAI